MAGYQTEPLRPRPPPPLWLRLIGIPIAPTRALVDLLRHLHMLQSGWSIIVWNSFFYFLIVLFYGLTFFGCNQSAGPLFLGPLAVLSLWRINELIYAFYRDAMDRIERYKPRSDLKDGVRVRLLLAAYAEIIVQFGIIIFAVSKLCGPAAYCGVDTLWDALYYSGITITTTGFGDIKPMAGIARITSVYEAVTGILFIAFTLATYLSPRAE